MNLKQTKDGVLVEVQVKPNSKRFKISIEAGVIVVFCKEHPIRGRVNRELVKKFSKVFHAKVELVSGATSRQKMLLIKGVDKKAVEKLVNGK